MVDIPAPSMMREFENAFIPPNRAGTPLHVIVRLSKEVYNQAAIRGRRWEPL